MQSLIFILFLFLQQVTPSPLTTPPVVKDTINWGFWAIVATIIGAAAAVVALYITVYDRFKARVKAHSVKERVQWVPGSNEELEEAFRYFVQPKCQDTLPAEGEAPTSLKDAMHLFDSLDKKLTHANTYKYLILLADSGMGKTTALINYCSNQMRRRRGPNFELKFVSLCLNSKAEDMIRQVEEKADTVLILDGLDENELAIVDCAEYVRLIVEATADFRTILISSRTHFFPKDEAIPIRTGVPVTGGLSGGQEPEHYFHRIYLLPFNDRQVKQFFALRYPMWRWRERKRAFKIIKSIPHLTARPSLLDHIPKLVEQQKDFRCSYDLYEEMVKAWLVRERYIKEQEPGSLIEFSEQLAVNLHLNRESRKSEKISGDEFMALAEELRCEIDIWKLRGRSLLNRDPAGNIKFADASVMEYLLVSRFFRGDPRTLDAAWTEQMHVFHWERVVRLWEGAVRWFQQDSFKLLLGHPKGVDILIRSHAIFSKMDIVAFPRETWDEFGVSVIAYMIYVAGYLKQSVVFKRVRRVAPTEFEEKRIRFLFSQGAKAQVMVPRGEDPSGEPALQHGESGREDITVYDYRGNFDAVMLAAGEDEKELPKQVADYFFPEVELWIRRAFIIRNAREQDIILAFQTTAPVGDELVGKIVRCARALF